MILETLTVTRQVREEKDKLAPFRFPVARHSRQILLGSRPPRPSSTPPRIPRLSLNKYVKAGPPESSKANNKMLSFAGMAPGSGQDAANVSQDVGEKGERGERGERGYRRRKLAAMAGNFYRSGQQAVTELRDSYTQSRGRGMDDFGINESTHIPGAFPDVAITSQGNEQMVLFPSYGKRHVKRDWTQAARNQASSDQSAQRDEEWWRQEWEKHEDEKAVVDIDTRGWIYSPHVGPMTRRNRILIGLARQLSGISAPRTDPAPGSTTGGGIAGELRTQHQIHEAVHEREKIAKEAAVIEKRGQQEKRVAYAGGYSEQPKDNNNLGVDAAAVPRHRRRGSYTPDSAPDSPALSARQPSSVGELTEAELAVANANLMARVAPFLTNPLVAMPITMFFYNETKSQSKTVLTDDAGHFNVRAALDFIPTHVRVLANEKLSATQEVKITEPAGISLISDIDDTIKRSNISGGAREIFRNTFVRDLGGLCIDGVREWYTDMHAMGVSMHYCSNSPWQLFPVLASYFKIAGLPPGSLHLKQYSGMLQGIFEPVAERKKTTLNRLIKDFPSRKFLLVGDSGEADLEVYTELALANPGRVIAIFIRDVTTPDTIGYFDPAFGYSQGRVSSSTLDDDGRAGHVNQAARQNSAPGAVSQEKAATGPAMGTLIDFSDEPEEGKLDETAALAQIKQQNSARTVSSSSATEQHGARKPPPPRPAKPAALRSTPALVNASEINAKADMPRPKPKRPQDPVPPPLPRRRSGLKNLSPRLFGRGGSSANADVDYEPLPPSAAAPPASSSFGFSYYRSGSRSGPTTPPGSPTLGAQGVNKKLELWRRRLLRAHEQLDSQGVVLHTWRTGHDVVAEAMGIVKHAQEEMRRRR